MTDQTTKQAGLRVVCDGGISTIVTFNDERVAARGLTLTFAPGQAPKAVLDVTPESLDVLTHRVQVVGDAVRDMRNGGIESAARLVEGQKIASDEANAAAIDRNDLLDSIAREIRQLKA